jgi:hypothetical protein
MPRTSCCEASGKHADRRARILVVLLAAATASASAPLTITETEHYTDNRGWNEAGLGPLYQDVVTATVVPSGHPTLVRAEQGGARQPLSHFAQPSTPNLYVAWSRVEPTSSGAWRIVAERGGAAATQDSPAIANPQPVPLLREVRVTGDPAAPRLSWQLPDLAGFDVDRIRVSVRRGERVLGRFMPVVHVSAALPPTATSFDIPAGVLVAGERHVFQVALEDLESGRLENRSMSFSEPHTPSR